MFAPVTVCRSWTAANWNRKRATATALALTIITATAAAPAAAAAPMWGDDPAPVPTYFYHPQTGADPLPKLLVQTWVIADADTGKVLAGRDPHRQMPPASTLKTLTAYTLLPRLQLDSPYNGTTEDAATEGAKVGIEAGAPYTVSDLFHGMLLPSGNDAASALANAYGGWKPTVAAMNSEANRLHLKETAAKNPSGLDDAGQLSSAWDLATIMRNGLQMPLFRQFISTRVADFPNKMPADPGRKRGTIPIYTENRLLLNNYPGAIGGKTGFTSQAGRTYVGSVQRGGRTLIVALMHSSTSTERAAEALLNWGFANEDKVTAVGTLPSADPPAAVTPQPAALLDPAGQPVGGGQAPSVKLNANGSINQNASSDGGGISLLAIFGWLLVALVAIVVGLRIRTVRRIKRNRAARAAARSPMVDIRTGSDQRPADSDTNPTLR